MERRLKVKTKSKEEKRYDEEEEEAVSPTSGYLLSEVATLYILSVFELAVPINSSLIYDFVNGDFVNSHPYFSCIPVEDEKGRKKWKKVEVNIEDHIKAATLAEGLSLEDYNEHLEDYMCKLGTSKMELNKPLWEFHVFNYCTTNATSTIIIKFDHAMGDGTSLMGVVLSSFKRTDDPTLPLTIHATNNTTTNTQNNSNPKKFKTTLINTFKIVPKFVVSMYSTLYDLGQSLRVFLFEDDLSPIKSGNKNMLRPGSVKFCSINLSLTDIKRVKSAIKVTVNDVIVGIISFAAQLYIQETEQSHKNSRITLAIPINIRSQKKYSSADKMRQGKTWGNKSSFIEISSPNLDQDDITSPVKYIKKIHKVMNRKKTSMGAIYLTKWIAPTIRLFAGFEATSKLFEKAWKNASVVITNMIGPIEQMSIQTHPVHGFYFLPTGVNLSLVVSVMSYMDQLRIGLVVENSFIDHHRLIACVEHAYHLILHAAVPPIVSVA